MIFKKYHVIEVVDERTLLIDYGLNNNAAEGNTLRIIKEGKPVIIDGKNYGSLDMIKGIVEVITPYEKFSICRKVSRRIVNPLNPLAAYQRTISQFSNLYVDRSKLSHRSLEEEIIPIKKGDVAILTNE